MIQTATDQPWRLAEAVGHQLDLSNWRPRHRCKRIARKVTPLVMDSFRDHGCYSWGNAIRTDNYGEMIREIPRKRVRAGLGIFQWLLWQFVIPKLIEWIIEWYFSSNGESMRARHRAEASE